MIDRKNGKFEYIILSLMILLAVFGLIVLYSASNSYSLKVYGISSYLFFRQLIFVIAGIVLMLVVSFIPYKLYLPFVKYVYIGCFILVVLTTFAGRISRGASRWIELRGVVFQPSEVMKLALILYLAKELAESYDKLNDKDKFLKVMIISYLPTFVVALNNLSTGIILFLIATFMIFVVSKKVLIFIFLGTIITMFYMFAYPIAKILKNVGLLKNYQVMRIFAWKDPENYSDSAYQTLQGLYAIGSGKITGKGYLSSIQKTLIPEAQNDMIFTILCEELGLLGALILLSLYIVLIFRIFYISFRIKSLTARLIAFGIGTHLSLQVIINILVVTNLLPNTGVTLPFVSYGGSSLIVMFVEIGIVMDLAKYREV